MKPYEKASFNQCMHSVNAKSENFPSHSNAHCIGNIALVYSVTHDKFVCLPYLFIN